MTAAPARKGCDIYLVPPHVLAAEGDLPLGILTKAERQRADRILDPLRGRQVARRRIILRRILGQALGLPADRLDFTTNADGKPELANHPMRFNLSASDGWIAVALSDGVDIGIDIERLRTIADSADMAERFFALPEAGPLSALPEPARSAAFLRCWTRKEAVTKALGHGMRAWKAAQEVGFRPCPETGQILDIGNERFRLHDIGAAPEVVISLARCNGRRLPKPVVHLVEDRLP